jgi:hypothetical protein
MRKTSSTPQPFEFSPSFHAIEDTGSFQPGDFEAQYEALYSEALTEGPITPEGRRRLDLAAGALGLRTERLSRVEEALRAAYQTGVSITITDPREVGFGDPGTLADRAPESIVPPTPELAAEDGDEAAPTPRTLPEIAPDDSDSAPDTPRTPDSEEPVPDDDDRATPPAMLAAMPVGERTDLDLLHDRFSEMQRAGALDEQFCTAAVLVRRGEATPAEQALYETHRSSSLQRPVRPLTTSAWATLLFHPQQDRTTGDIFAVIASAALLARVSAMRKDGALPKLDPAKKHDPETSTVSVARALGWCASTLGLRAPPTYLAPEMDSGLEIVVGVPPVVRVGKHMLSGLSAVELAFHCGRHLTWFREEYFICSLVPSVVSLEDIFLGALLIGEPNLPLRNDALVRAGIIRNAVVPVLEPHHVERLRGLTQVFLEQGGKTSLRLWAQAAEFTACRAGLLTCGDLAVACEALAREPNGEQRIAEVEGFWASDAASELRRDLGVALTA